MIVKNNAGNPKKHSNVWELYVTSKMKTKIRKIADKRGVTMSWIMRFCAFRLARKRPVNLMKHQKYATKLSIRIAKIKIDLQRCSHKERAYLCLWGSDELFLRLASANSHLTVSMFIRLALDRYLDKLLHDTTISSYRLFWYGIKLYCGQINHRLIIRNFLGGEFRLFRHYSLADYWGVPDGDIPRHILR